MAKNIISPRAKAFDRVSLPMVRHRMAYIAHEPRRQTLKYRCPARHQGWQRPSDQQSNAGKYYGKTGSASATNSPTRASATARLAVPQRRNVRSRQALRQDCAGEADDRPAALPAHPPGHAALGAAVQGPHGRGTGQRPTESLLKVFWGADDGNIGGACRFFAFVGVVMIVRCHLPLVSAFSC